MHTWLHACFNSELYFMGNIRKSIFFFFKRHWHRGKCLYLIAHEEVVYGKDFPKPFLNFTIKFTILKDWSDAL